MEIQELFVKEKPIYVGACAVYKFTPELAERMVVATAYDEPFNLARTEGEFLHIPRNLYRGPCTIRMDQRVFGVPIQLGVNPKFKPRDEDQSRVIDDSHRLLRSGKNHVINAATGFGKTFCALNIAAKMGLKTLIVVNKADQITGSTGWVASARKFLNISDKDIGIIRQDKCQYKDKKIVVGMIHSLSKEKYPEEIYKEFGLVIFDEVHHIPADTFSIVAGLFYAQFRLGLSATTERSDRKEFIYIAHIGPVMIEAKTTPMSPKVMTMETGWKLPLVHRPVDGRWQLVPLPHDPGKLGAVVVAMSKNAARNNLIVSLIVKAHKKGRWVVVMSELAKDKHLTHLFDLCVAKGIPAEDMGYYVGTMGKKALEEAKTKHVVFATYGMTAEATDVPWWDCLILATPRANVKQAVGRILRTYPDKKQPVVFDLIDGCSKVLRQYAMKRRSIYESEDMGAEIIDL